MKSIGLKVLSEHQLSLSSSLLLYPTESKIKMSLKINAIRKHSILLYYSGFFWETEPIGYRRYIYIKREGGKDWFILRSWLTWIWGLASPKSSGQSSRPEMQEIVDIAVLSMKANCKYNSSFLRGPQFFS